MDLKSKTPQIHHHVLVVEGEKSVRKMLNEWLHTVEREIEVDQVETVDEAKERLRHQGGNPYDMVIADEYLPGLGTGMDLYRHCTDEYPTVPVMMTSRDDLRRDLDLTSDDSPIILNPAQPRVGRYMIEQMLPQRPVLERDRRAIDSFKLGAFVLTLAGLLSIFGPALPRLVEAILQRPPFVDRFFIPQPQQPALPEMAPETSE